MRNATTSFASLAHAGRRYRCIDLAAVAGARLAALPFSLRVVLENLLRHRDDEVVTQADIDAVLACAEGATPDRSLAFRPVRVLMQDFTGVPGLVDLAAMRDAMAAAGRDPAKVNPLVPVDLIVDHSLLVEHAGSAEAMARNVRAEYADNVERYGFLRWAQGAFGNMRIAPPGAGIMHQVNLEHLARVAWLQDDLLVPDTLIGTDSHTTMTNALGVLGWGVGGIEAEAAMLGQPLVMQLPQVVGVRLQGALQPGVTATDLVLTLTQQLRRFGVVEQFVEFCGPALDKLGVADRATLANMAPEYGSTCGFFPVDRATVDYLNLTGRDGALAEVFARAAGLWREAGAPEPRFSRVMEFDLSAVEPSAAGPRRPQDHVPLAQVPASFRAGMQVAPATAGFGHGAVAIAAITSCTNTSNPGVMLAAGLLARNAVARGLRMPAWVKTSLTPGSRVVAQYLAASGLQQPLDALGFQLTGFGCGTCAGNSGALAEDIAAEIRDGDLTVCAVLSGNRNFEGRIHPQAKAAYLMSPPLVVAYALAGSIDVDLTTQPLGIGSDGAAVMLRDIWPSGEEIAATQRAALSADGFRAAYAPLFDSPAEWSALPGAGEALFRWNPGSTYIRRPPYFEMPSMAGDIIAARPLLVLGDSITTDHISPVSRMPVGSPAAEYLTERQVPPRDWGSFGTRRANHEIMMRGTFGNIRLRNALAEGREGGWTKHQPSGDLLSVHAAAERYAAEGTALVVVAGREYGTGSSRDWAAKGTRLLGVRAVLAESFERIHRSNLVMMGVLPLELPGACALGLDGTETFDITVGEAVTAMLRRADGSVQALAVRCRLDNAHEWRLWRAGGILPYVFQQLAA
jgi:aconitate hydratase